MDKDIDLPNSEVLPIRGEPTFWAFDSEFLMSGKAGQPEDVMSIQFSNGEDITVVVESSEQLKEWLYHHDYIKIMYGFAMLCDLGSVREWLGNKSTEPMHYKGSQLLGCIKYRHTKIRCFDIRPMCQSFGWRRLEDCGVIVGVPKLAKPEWLGKRRWLTRDERKEFLEYAKVDAIITSKTAKLLASPPLSVDPAQYCSCASVVSDYFKLPRRLKRAKRTVLLSPLEKLVAKNIFAGRSDGFVTGFIPNVCYNDVSSLYPVSCVTTKSLCITQAKPCDPSDIVVSQDLNETCFGWLEGSFESYNDLWGLPIKAKNNAYVCGKVQGFFHTFDLASAKAKILHVTHAYKPVFTKDLTRHNAYADFLLQRIEGELDESKPMKSFAKGLLNSLIGKFGQAKPSIATTSNFFAYSTVMAHSHLVMSMLFDKCAGHVLAMDTDSIFSHSDMTGKWFETTAGERTIPVTMSVKGKGDLAFFRSKRYILKGQDGVVYGQHGWVYPKEDFLKLWDGAITELYTRKDVHNTLLTNVIEAKKLAKGRWFTKPVKLDLAKLKELLTADPKRKRETYDSYQQVMDRKSVPSQAWRYEELLSMEHNPLDYPKA